MFISEGIVSNVFWKLEAVVVLLKNKKEYLFADFPIGATIQDGGKRKRSRCVTTVTCLFIIK